MNEDRKDDMLPDFDSFDLDWLSDDLPEAPTPKPAEKPKAAPEPEAPVRRRAPEAETPVRRRAPEPEAPVRRRAPEPEAPVRRRAPEPEAPVRRRAPEPEAPVRRRAPEAQVSRAAEAERIRYGGGRRRRGAANGPIIALVIVLVLGLAVVGFLLGRSLFNYHRDRSAYDDLASRATAMLAEQYEEEEQTETAEGGGSVRVTSEVPITVDWNYLRSVNSHVVGWLYCEDTVINYPVVQVQDHDYYLNHGFDGKENNAGTLFADRNSVIGITQSNYIIYGHNMKDESMFGTFKEYVNKSYFDEHPVLYYLTPSGNYRIELICAQVVEATDEYYPGYFSSETDYQAYLNKITAGAYWVNYDAVTTEHQLISMSTCTSSGGFNDPRFLLQGMLIPIQ